MFTHHAFGCNDSISVVEFFGPSTGEGGVRLPSALVRDNTGINREYLNPAPTGGHVAIKSFSAFRGGFDGEDERDLGTMDVRSQPISRTAQPTASVSCENEFIEYVLDTARFDVGPPASTPSFVEPKIDREIKF